jgi:hypothetical protein
MKVNGPGARPRRDLARSGRGAQRHGPPGGREDQPRARDGQQRDAVPRRHPAHQPGAAAEVHLAVRRAAQDRGRVEGPHAHLRPARQEVLRGHGRQPVHRVRREVQIPDMLANRADTYNLGDILGARTTFALSTSRTRSPRTRCSRRWRRVDPADLHKLIRMAKGEAVPDDRAVAPVLGGERLRDRKRRCCKRLFQGAAHAAQGEPSTSPRRRRTIATGPSRPSSSRAATGT